jgi:SPP1 family predicted phage head-tail adaptor
MKRRVINSPELDRRVTIRRASYSQDSGSGEMLETWSDLAEVWASWRRASSRETLASAEVSAEVTDVFTMRWSPVLASVTPKDRVLYQGREYNVSEVTEVGRREGMMIRGAARAE